MAKPLGPGYMPALDGLRALAVAAVFLYHLRLPFIPGGFLGVDVFFVISGFLITMLLVTEAERTNRVRLGAFWIRRGRRLFPALVAMVAVVCAVALFIGRDLDVGLRGQVLGAAVYGSNWLQIASGQAYVESYEPLLFTHLWSLAVEEQFYLIWPFVVVLLLSFLSTKRMRVCVILAAAAASAVWMGFAYIPGADPTRAYVGTDTHGFALLLGAALGVGMQVVRPGVRTRIPSRHRTPAFFGLVGLLGVLGGMLFLTDTGEASFRGGIVAVDIAAVALVAAAARGVGVVGATFAAPLLTWIGRRSYAIYLWHWPVIVIAERSLPIGTALWVLVAIAISVTMVAAEISWRFVEVPIRTLGFAGWLRHLRDLVLGVAPATELQARRPGWSGPTVGVRSRPAGRSPGPATGSDPGSGVVTVPAVRRGLGWLGVGVMLSVVVLAACGVAGAPERSSLEAQLATAQAALVNHSRTAEPLDRTTSSDPPVIDDRPSITVVEPALPATVSPSPATTRSKTSGAEDDGAEDDGAEDDGAEDDGAEDDGAEDHCRAHHLDDCCQAEAEAETETARGSGGRPGVGDRRLGAAQRRAGHLGGLSGDRHRRGGQSSVVGPSRRRRRARQGPGCRRDGDSRPRDQRHLVSGPDPGGAGAAG